MLPTTTTATVVRHVSCRSRRCSSGVCGEGERESDNSAGSLLLGFSPRSYVTPGEGEVRACRRASASGRGRGQGQGVSHAPMSSDYQIEGLFR
jgi:hypothetical protein